MKSGTSFIRVIVIILSVLAIFYGLIFLGLSSFTRFHVHENLSYEQKASNARAALMPDVAGYVERYGLRGFQDVDCQVETVKFDSIDNLVAAIPSLECYKSSATSEGTDIKGKKASLQMVNDYGSEDLEATLTRQNDSIYVLRQGKGSTIKVPADGKWQKLPPVLPFKRQ